MIRYLRSLFIAARNLPFCPNQKWESADAEKLTTFLASTTGRKFRDVLANMVVSTQNSAISQTNTLQHSCGYASGFRGAVATIESLATVTLSEPEETTDSIPELEHLNP